MKNIRQKDQRIRLTTPQDQSSCPSDQYPWVSFRYMTANKDFTVECLERLSGQQRETTLLNLYRKLVELSSRPWSYWLQQRKASGMESMDYSRLHFQANQDAGLTSDTKVYILRFDTHLGSGKGRIIGFKQSPCAVLHIIGYDFDFSSYNH